MWPGLVGKGSPAPSRRSISTRCSISRRPRGRTASSSTASNCFFRSARQHRLDATTTSSGSRDKIAAQGIRRRLARRAGVAADRRRFGDGRARTIAGTSSRRCGRRAHRQEAARTRHPHVRRRPHRLGVEPGEWAKDPDGQHQEDRRDVPRGLRHRRRHGETARRGRRDLLGRHAQLEAHGRSCSRWSNRPKTLGFQADMAHTLLYTLGYNAPEDRILPEATTGRSASRSTRRCRQVTDALRPWTIDFHVAQNDATVKGSGSHDKTGRHCLPNDPERQARHRPPRRLLAARRRRQADAGVAAHLLGRLHVPQRDDDEAADVERRSSAR